MPWFRDTYTEAVWSSTDLKPAEKLVALTYGQHAGAPKPKPDSDVSWVTWPRLSERTGIRSKTTLSKIVRSLEAKGWFELVEGKRQHKSPRYRLLIPASPEVQFLNVWNDGTTQPEVQKLDDSSPGVTVSRGPETEQLKGSEVQKLAPEVQKLTARGPETEPDLSNNNLNNKPPIPTPEPQDARTAPRCRHKWTADGDCLKCKRHEPCPECRRLARINDTIRCYQHQDHQEAS